MPQVLKTMDNSDHAENEAYPSAGSRRSRRRRTTELGKVWSGAGEQAWAGQGYDHCRRECYAEIERR